MGFIPILYYAPQVILITDEALFRAKKLYEVTGTIESPTEPISGFSSFTNYRVRLKAYIDSIPSDIIEELKLKSGIIK